MRRRACVIVLNFDTVVWLRVLNIKTVVPAFPFFCPEGHLASISRDGLLNGAWCKTCNPVLRYTLGEELVRLAFQLMFGKQFPKSRPSFLINPDTGYPLELDGYCEELQLAFEYHGNQHFQFIPYFHKTVDSFEAAKVRDEYTRQLAKEHGMLICTQN